MFMQDFFIKFFIFNDKFKVLFNSLFEFCISLGLKKIENFRIKNNLQYLEKTNKSSLSFLSVILLLLFSSNNLNVF